MLFKVEHNIGVATGLIKKLILLVVLLTTLTVFWRVGADYYNTKSNDSVTYRKWFVDICTLFYGEDSVAVKQAESCDSIVDVMFFYSDMSISQMLRGITQDSKPIMNITSYDQALVIFSDMSRNYKFDNPVIECRMLDGTTLLLRCSVDEENRELYNSLSYWHGMQAMQSERFLEGNSIVKVFKILLSTRVWRLLEVITIVAVLLLVFSLLYLLLQYSEFYRIISKKQKALTNENEDGLEVIEL